MTQTCATTHTQDQCGAKPQSSAHSYRPAVDILEREGELLILADMPGASPNKLDIHFENGLLTIHGEVAERQPAEQPYMLLEYRVGHYHREFQVSDQVDASRITADFKDGVLSVHLPKLAALLPRKINVTAS